MYGKFKVIKNIEISKNLQIFTTTLNNQPVIQVSDKKITRPIKLVTVTDLDADFAGKTPEQLAQEWKEILRDELIRGVKLLSPEELRKRLLTAGQILIVAIGVSLLLWLAQKFVNRKLLKLKTQQAEELAKHSIQQKNKSFDPNRDSLIAMRSHFIDRIRNKFSLQKPINLYSFGQWLLFWCQVILWYLTIIRVCATIPVLMQYQNWVLAFPLDILLVCFLVSVGIKLSNNIIDRIFNAWKERKFISLGEIQRKEVRTETISKAVKGLVNFLFVFFAIASILDLFGISTSSIVAGGAVIGVAVSLGSQNVIKDLVNGFLILAEDQYAVGDVIGIGNVSGLVENLNLRVTQIRSPEGSLVTIPNSSITQVENLTRNWSRVNFTITIAHAKDLDLALKLLTDIGQKMHQDVQWREQIVEAPEVLGVDEINYEGLLIRVWISTEPLQQWSIGREYRYRVSKVFAEHHIETGKVQLLNSYPSLPSLQTGEKVQTN